MIEPHVPPLVRGPRCILLDLANRDQGVCDLLGCIRETHGMPAGTKQEDIAVQQVVGS
jgi:hypothetical protein